MIERILKYAAIIIAAAAVIAFIIYMRSCSSTGITARSTFVPRDSNFVSVERQDYQPPSLPLSKRKLPIKLPAGLRERDVSKIITLEVGHIARDSTKTFNIIETKEGEIFLERDSSVQSLGVTTITPAILGFSVHLGIGFSVGGFKLPLSVRPSVAFSPVEWSGWLQAPTVVVDWDGAGFGAQARIYHDFYVGVDRLWRYEGGAQIKTTLHFML